ncbi:MAG: hypothetical protein J7L51_02930, partial [Desulfurococcales archaeon]|nr:hypothetical protein [Desulfurococcales archaeon]
MEPKRPREEVLEKFRRAFFREKHGVGYQQGASTKEEFLEEHREEIEEEGLLMSSDHTVAIFTGPKGNLAESLLRRLTEAEPMEMVYDLDLLREYQRLGRLLRIGGATFDPEAVAKVLRVLGEEDSLGEVHIRVYPPSEIYPVFFVNE